MHQKTEDFRIYFISNFIFLCVKISDTFNLEIDTFLKNLKFNNFYFSMYGIFLNKNKIIFAWTNNNGDYHFTSVFIKQPLFYKIFGVQKIYSTMPLHSYNILCQIFYDFQERFIGRRLVNIEDINEDNFTEILFSSLYEIFFKGILSYSEYLNFIKEEKLCEIL